MTSQDVNNGRMLHCMVAEGGRTLFSGETGDVVLPGVNGVVEVLPSHAECFVALGKGEIVVAVGEDEEEAYPVDGGVAHVRGDRLVVLL